MSGVSRIECLTLLEFLKFEISFMVRQITDLFVRNKKVLLRLDLNLPRISGKEYDLSRLKRSLPTLNYLINQGARTIILSHYGNPKGKFAAHLSLAPITDILKNELGGAEVKFLLDILSPEASKKIASMQPGEVLLVENLRFHPEEEANDLEFAKSVARLADCYVNEAFSCSHRKHASIVSVPTFLPSALGLLVTEELNSLQKYLEKPQRPMLAIVGGAKISSKLEMLMALANKVDVLSVCGAMANTFLHGCGYSVGKSIYEVEHVELAKKAMALALKRKCTLLLPHDFIVRQVDGDDRACRVVNASQIRSDDTILDIGPSSIFNLLKHLNKAATVVWNGPLGLFEQTPFDIATSTLARSIAGLTAHNKLISVIGGGDVVSAINMTGLNSCFTYISTGGGAFLKWLEGATLPGIAAIAMSEQMNV
jgi:phosphoglycerate kinase